MADLKALEARIRDFLGGALRTAMEGNVVDWRTNPDVLADEIIRWIADVVEDETVDLRAAVARAEQATAETRRALEEIRDCTGPLDGHGPEYRIAVAALKRLAADVPAAPEADHG